MLCRVCGEDTLTPLWAKEPGTRNNEWLRCLACGSDSSPDEYDATQYADGQSEKYAYADRGTMAACVEALRSNLEWFRDHRGGCPDNSFLDVGCAEGAALAGMQDMGWSVHGFDVSKPSYYGPHVTVAPEFTASLFPQRYSAVLCREVIEHVTGWRAMIGELHAVTARNGLMQLQTPRPMNCREPWFVYQTGHLQIISPAVLRYWLERTGFDVIDYRFWSAGQAWICRRPH